jgi:hypothetical protein
MNRIKNTNKKFEGSDFGIMLMNDVGKWIAGSHSGGFMSSLVLKDDILLPG